VFRVLRMSNFFLPGVVGRLTPSVFGMFVLAFGDALWVLLEGSTTEALDCASGVRAFAGRSSSLEISETGPRVTVTLVSRCRCHA